MRNSIFALGVIVCLGLAGTLTLSIPQTSWADSDVAQTKDQSQSFTIKNMTCATCPISVKKAMQRVDGVQHVEVDFETKTAVVVFDPRQTTVTAIADASTNVGYPATPTSD